VGGRSPSAGETQTLAGNPWLPRYHGARLPVNAHDPERSSQPPVTAEREPRNGDRRSLSRSQQFCFRGAGPDAQGFEILPERIKGLFNTAQSCVVLKRSPADDSE
jgi:hypothetical protein